MPLLPQREVADTQALGTEHPLPHTSLPGARGHTLSSGQGWVRHAPLSSVCFSARRAMMSPLQHWGLHSKTHRLSPLQGRWGKGGRRWAGGPRRASPSLLSPTSAQHFLGHLSSVPCRIREWPLGGGPRLQATPPHSPLLCLCTQCSP